MAKLIKKDKKSSKKALYCKYKALLGIKDTEYCPKDYYPKEIDQEGIYKGVI